MAARSLKLNVRLLFLLPRNELFSENRDHLVFLDLLFNDSTARRKLSDLDMLVVEDCLRNICLTLPI